MSRVDGTRKTVFFYTIKIMFLLFRTAGVFRVPWRSEEYKVKVPVCSLRRWVKSSKIAQEYKGSTNSNVFLKEMKNFNKACF